MRGRFRGRRYQQDFMWLVRNGSTGLRGLQKGSGRSRDGRKGMGLRGGCAMWRAMRLGRDWNYGRLNCDCDIFC
jgi:hypothetical protein